MFKRGNTRVEMTDKTWFGGTGSFTDARDWSPTGVPAAGDSITLGTGTLEVKDQNLLDIPLTMGSFYGATLDLDDSILGNVGLTSIPAPSGELGGEHTINVSGIAVTAGTITTDGDIGDATTINIGNHSSLLNIGTVDITPDFGGTLIINGSHGSLVTNDGLIEVYGGPGATITIGSNVVGFGTIELGVAAQQMFDTPTGTAEFKGSVGAEQTFKFSGDGTTESHVTLQIDMAEAFKATIADFTKTDTIDLRNTTVTSDRFNDGVLILNDGCDPVAHLHFAGSYTTGDFTTQAVGGDTLIKLA